MMRQAIVWTLLMSGWLVCGDRLTAQQRRPAPRTTPARPAVPPQPQPSTPKPSRAEQLSIEELKATRAVIESAAGNIVLEFFPERAPNHVRNFLRLAEQGYYDGTEFNRIVKDFVIQGGDPAKWPADSPNRKLRFDTSPLKAEFNETPHDKGILSMAHGKDPDSATTHYFICLRRAESLDGKYTAFGRVVEGLEVVDKIAETPIQPGAEDKPAERVEVRTIRVIYPKP
ncbi:MAG: peptidylprolyl isomerase [Chloracidobacterium sp.]|uniref:Peptidyl-prolyl cis-trans isomerase n=1 Tax=Chloracidobacterium validum TaxID=2821543 RepID=A0ABX8BAQ7_9BACT|nr:peptidylprolyl isomerase [Chloracidobacterium validum]QUW02630.1 peptidylprolyl isomerase [Chloracidobacterium validum]